MTWDIALQGVTFAYQPGRPILFDVNLQIAEGAIVALVGATGAGKTTVSNLIPRFYDPQEGAVRIGGHDVRTLDLDFLRGHIATVLQDVFLFHGSVRQISSLVAHKPPARDDRAARPPTPGIYLPPAGRVRRSSGARGQLSAGQKHVCPPRPAEGLSHLILDEETPSVDTETRASDSRSALAAHHFVHREVLPIASAPFAMPT
jgi:ABC-type transport system involved in cytochrome bd biosynthesis fused ATPase/permease subunit